MNQNRNSNRRRGRGGNRGQGGGNQGNRIDSRARGNAPQLLEKYKKLAHDASLNGDRVQTEYYLQFADHYFRVVADSRAQREEQRPRRDDRDDRDYGREAYDDGDDTEELAETGRPRHSRDDDSPPPAEEGEPGSEADEVEMEERNPFVRQSRGQQRPRGRKRPANGASDDAEVAGGNGEGGFDAAVLPPAISREEEPKPRRSRARRARPADDADGEALEAVG